MATKSKSQTQASQAGSQTGQAQAGTGVDTRAAGAQTGAGQAGAGAVEQGSGAKVTSDINQNEAYILNLKRLVENAQDLDQELKQVTITSAQRLARNAEDYDAQVRASQLRVMALQEQVVANSIALNNRINQQALTDDVRANDNAGTFDKQNDSLVSREEERSMREGDLGGVIRWESIAQNPVFTDAIAGAVAKAVAAVVVQQQKGA